jgi:hypothetical protein
MNNEVLKIFGVIVLLLRLTIGTSTIYKWLFVHPEAGEK